MRRVLIASLLAASIVVLAAPAAAHGPRALSPAPGSEVGGPLDRIELLFAEPMSPDGMFIVVTDEGGAAVPSTGPARLDEESGLAFVEIEPITTPGAYRVDYRVVGRDGVTTPGAYLFTFNPAAPPPTSLEATAMKDPGGFPWMALALGIGFASLLVVRFGRKAWRRW